MKRIRIGARIDDMAGYKVHHVGVYAYQEYGSNVDGGYRAVIEKKKAQENYIFKTLELVIMEKQRR